MPFSFASVRARTQDQRDILKWGALSLPTELVVRVLPIGSESAPHFNMSLWSWVRALTEAKEKGMGHAPIACEWDHPSSEWARGWDPYKKRRLLIVKAPLPSPLRRGVVPLTGYRGMSHALFFRLRESSNPRPKGHIEMGSTLTTN